MLVTPESLLKEGYQARKESRLSDARAAYAEAVALSREYNNLTLVAVALKRLGEIERDFGKTDAALGCYLEAAAVQRALPADFADALGLAHTLRHVADILTESGQPTPALPLYREALSIYRRHPETRLLDLANTLRGFALQQSSTGETQSAIALWQEAGDLYGKVHIEAGIAESQRQIALLSNA